MTDEIIRLTGIPKATAQREVARFAEQNPNLPKKDLIANGITNIVQTAGHNITPAILQSTIKMTCSRQEAQKAPTCRQQ